MNNSVVVTEGAEYTHVGPAVRRALADLGLPRDNPLGGMVEPGGSVTIKPNWVNSANPLGHSLDSLVTHPDVVVAATELAAQALDGHGTILIADAPIQGCDFDGLQQKMGLNQRLTLLRQTYPDVHIRIEDWRCTILPEPQAKANQRSDSQIGYRLIDVGSASFLEDVSDRSDRFRVTCYPPSAMSDHHKPGRHEYLVAAGALDSDLLINLPKMKTHKKAGLTGALKNLVGINGHKEYLPHHIQGAPRQRGDEYQQSSRLRRISAAVYDHVWEHREQYGRVRLPLAMQVSGVLEGASRRLGDGIDPGSWIGNDTVWRMTLDLNHLLLTHRRGPVIHIVDGIVAGQGEGPLAPSPRTANLLIAGFNPAHIDAVIAQMIGYAPDLIRTVERAMNDERSAFASAWDFPVLRRVGGEVTTTELGGLPSLDFDVPRTWQAALRPKVA